MAMMQFELVSPERRLASGEASAVQIPGAEGDFTAMADHAPTISTLRPGILTVEGPSGTEEYFVTGGFAEINAQGTSVLAERAWLKSDVTQEIFSEVHGEAHKAHASASEDAVDAAAKLLADMVAVGTHIGLDTNSPSL